MIYEIRHWKTCLRNENEFVLDLYSQKGFLKSSLNKYLTYMFKFPFPKCLGVEAK